jgi:hypothetical protein
VNGEHEMRSTLRPVTAGRAGRRGRVDDAAARQRPTPSAVGPFLPGTFRGDTERDDAITDQISPFHPLFEPEEGA